MCRVLSYLGEPVLLDDLLYKPDNSLVRQSYEPKMMSMLNLAGFGMTAWDSASYEPDIPFTYKTPSFPVFDQNLRQLARKIRAGALLAHVRGVPYSDRSVIGAQNLHPFRFEGVKLAMAHNGDLIGFDQLKFDLLEYIRPEMAAMIRGTTDSEWMYALLLSQVSDPAADLRSMNIVAAVEKTLGLIQQVRERHDLRIHSPANLFLCDGRDLATIHYTFDYGCYPEDPAALNVIYPSMWYTFGREYGFRGGEWKMTGSITSFDSVIIASEPLTRDVSTWLEVPEYSMLLVSLDADRSRIDTIALDA
jgi:glutamine amidotransferase